jgi:hypothetical protein
MKVMLRVLFSVITLALFVTPTLATEFTGEVDGPWVNVDVVDLVSYGDAKYLEYLGKGYVAMLETLKAEGGILDYGVMMRVTGAAGDGDVVIWWSVESLADYEKAGERIEVLAAELHDADEWGEIWSELEQVRTIRSSNFYRAVNWEPVE